MALVVVIAVLFLASPNHCWRGIYMPGICSGAAPLPIVSVRTKPPRKHSRQNLRTEAQPGAEGVIFHFRLLLFFAQLPETDLWIENSPRANARGRGHICAYAYGARNEASWVAQERT